MRESMYDFFSCNFCGLTLHIAQARANLSRRQTTGWSIYKLTCRLLSGPPCGSTFRRDIVTRSLIIVRCSLEEQQLSQPFGAPPLSKRHVAQLSPRLGVLNNIPFAIPFETRVSIFRMFITSGLAASGTGPINTLHRTNVTVRRGHIAEDGFDRLSDVDLKASIAITFIDQFGEPECVKIRPLLDH